MTIRISTEEARAYVATEHPDSLEIPRSVDNMHTANHLASAIIFASMGESGQEHNVGKLYVFFRRRSPSWFDKHLRRDPETVRLEAIVDFEDWERGAKLRVKEGKSPTILDGLQWESGNQWRVDEDPVGVYAVDASGDIAEVEVMGGYITPEDRAWPSLLQRIQTNIDREFRNNSNDNL